MLKNRTISRRSSKFAYLAFLTGVFSGFFISELYKDSEFESALVSFKDHLKPHPEFTFNETVDEVISEVSSISTVPTTTTTTSTPQEKIKSTERPINDRLYDEVKVACLTMTRPDTHETQGRQAKNVWGHKCNKLAFMSTIEAIKNDTLGVVALDAKEGKSNLWKKAKEMMKYAYYNLLDDYDWFYKNDDDTFVIMENLRYFLYPLNTSYPIAFGFRLAFTSKATGDHDYFSGGAGYVMSKAALKILIEDGILKENGTCRKGDTGNEDLNVVDCMRLNGVVLGNPVDYEGKQTFHMFKANQDMALDTVFKNDGWIWKYVYYKPKYDLDFSSDYPISFHYIRGAEQYWYQYLMYGLKIYGAKNYPHPPLPDKMTYDEMDKRFNVTSHKFEMFVNGTLNLYQ